MKGKKFKKPQPIQLREMQEITQPDYAEKATLVYHIDRITKLSDAAMNPPPEPKPSKEKKPAEQNGEQKKEDEKSELQPTTIYQPPITNEALYDFQITQVRLFPNCSRLLQVQDDPDYVFQDMDKERGPATRAGN